MEIFQNLNYNGATIIVITHDRDIAKMAKEIMLIRDGLLSPLNSEENTF
ncbi:MAG: hypothetical protein GX928_06695 [Ruminococcaceae bacterium]|nr:hypothetical protein [Oscillospiraceae bacterium]